MGRIFFPLGANLFFLELTQFVARLFSKGRICSFGNKFVPLTHYLLVDSSTIIRWTSLFPKMKMTDLLPMKVYTFNVRHMQTKAKMNMYHSSK